MRARMMIALSGLLGLPGCQTCSPPPPPPDMGPRPSAVSVVQVGPSRASVGPPGQRMPARDCRKGEVKLTLSGPAGPNGLLLETAVSPPNVLTVDPVRVPEGATSLRVEARGETVGTARVRFRAPGQACDLQRDCPSVEITVLAEAGCLACNSDGVGRATYSAPVCRRDTFYLEAEWASPTPCAVGRGGVGFQRALTKALQRGAAGSLPLEQAICGWGAPECVRACGSDRPPRLAQGYTVRPVVTPVLPDGDEARGRFFRVHYEINGPKGSTRTHELPAWAVCEGVDRLQRAEVAALREVEGDAACSHAPNPMVCDGQGLKRPSFKAGLECPVRPTQIRAMATAEQKTWHLTRLRDGLASLPAAAPTTPTTVFMFDSGLHPNQRTATAQVETFGEAAFDDPDGADRLPHGTAMAGLIKAVAPFVDLKSVRVFGTDGVARTDRLALALSHAHRTMRKTPGHTYLLNLSLGWPAEFSLPTVLQGGQVRWDRAKRVMTETACTALNEGVGESVRYTLARIARDDALGKLRASVLSAAGNLPPGEVDLTQRRARLRGGAGRCGGKVSVQVAARWVIDNLERISQRGREGGFDLALLRPFPNALERNEAGFVRALNAALDDVAQAATATAVLDAVSAQLDAPWCAGAGLAPRPFLPAAWGLPSGGAEMLGPLDLALKVGGRAQCVASDLALAVGAHDARGRLSYHHPQTVSPSLALPGQQVFAPAPDAPALNDADVDGCSGLPPSTTDQPLPVSGTSAATALATGVAALAQAGVSSTLAPRFGALARPGLDAARLKRLLRLVGPDAAGQGAATPAGARARQPSLCQLNKALTTCAAFSTKDVDCLVTGGPACTEFATRCDVSACGTPAEVPAAPAGYPQGSCTPAPTVNPDPQGWTSPCQGNVDCLSGFEAGVLGPQPDDPLCEFCGIRVERPGANVSNPVLATVTLEFGSGFPYDSHRIENPRLLAVVNDGGWQKGYFDLDVGTEKLYAGWSAKVTGLKVHTLSDSTSAWKAADAYLVVDVVDLKTGKKRTVFEPLAVKVNPP